MECKNTFYQLFSNTDQLYMYTEKSLLSKIIILLKVLADFTLLSFSIITK